MYSASSSFFQVIADSSREFKCKASIKFRNGDVIETTDFMNHGIEIQNDTSSSGSFDLGAAIIGKLTLTLNNFDGQFSDYDFTDCIIWPYIGLIVDGSVEWVPMGVFVEDNANVSDFTVTVEALDRLSLLDKPYSDSLLTYPATLLQIFKGICNDCGVQYATTVFPNSEYIVPERPNDEALTYREMLSYVAQLAGRFAHTDREGRIALNWYGDTSGEVEDEIEYDGGNFTDYSSGDNLDGGSFWTNADSADGGTFGSKGEYKIPALKSLSVETDEITITGITFTAQVVEEGEEESEGETVTYISGTEGYTFDLTENPLIQHDVQSALDTIAAEVVGLTFRPYSAAMYPNPALDAGDAVILTDRKGNEYSSVITSLSYTHNGSQNISAEAETPSDKQSTRYDAVAKLKSDVNIETTRKITTYDKQVQLLNELILNSMGVYKSTVTNPDGSVTYYTHDAPTLEESSYISCETSNGFAYTNNGWNDGDPVWQYGNTKDGNLICNVLSAVGIICDWIKGGTLQLGGSNNANGQAEMLDENGEVCATWDCSGFESRNDLGRVWLAGNALCFGKSNSDEPGLSIDVEYDDVVTGGTYVTFYTDSSTRIVFTDGTSDVTINFADSDCPLSINGKKVLLAEE